MRQRLMLPVVVGVNAVQSRQFSSTPRRPSHRRMPGASALEWYKHTCELMAEGKGANVGGHHGHHHKKNSQYPSAPQQFQMTEGLWKELHQYVRRTQNLPEEIVVGLWDVYVGAKTNETRLAFVRNLASLTMEKDVVLTVLADVQSSLGVAPTAEELAACPAAANHLTVKQLKKLDTARAALTPVYARWFLESQTLAGGTKLLLDLRASLVRLDRWVAKQTQECTLADRHAVSTVLGVLTEQLRQWFQIAWLATARLSWDRTPPSVIENVMKHEQVHPFPSLEASQHRMAPTENRQMFAFYHPTIPFEPLVTIQVALCKGIASSVDQILWQERMPGSDVEEVDVPDTAMFYSINATQEGLQGIELGKFLIQKAVSEFQRREKPGDPDITTFCTLSPIPQYVTWLKTLCSGKEHHRAFSDKYAQQDIQSICTALEADVASAEEAVLALVRLAESSSEAAEPYRWYNREGLSAALEKPLLRSVAHYLCHEKKRGAVYDPVGNFHLKNGATLFRLNWLGNKTSMGSAQSLCVMVNYLYELDRTVSNAFSYEFKGTVQYGAPLQELL